jgi:hypothetical protein
MTIFYVWDIRSKIYAGSVECKKGMNPSNSTELKPLPFKAMNEIVWNGNAWEYQPM